MPIYIGGKLSYTHKAEIKGKELLEMWLNLGSLDKVLLRYNAEHPEEMIKQVLTVRSYIRLWMMEHPEEAVEVVKQYDPNTTREEVLGKIIYYATRELRSLEKFIRWAADKPWTKPYEKHYREYYDFR